MKITALIESDRFQVGIVTTGLIPQWNEDTLDAGVTAIDSGLLIATYPDLDFRKRSIPITVMDSEETDWKTATKGWNFLGEYKLKTQRGTVDVGCIPTICDGTSGRLVFDRDKIKLSIYGDAPREPKKLLVFFSNARIIGAIPDRSRV